MGEGATTGKWCVRLSIDADVSRWPHLHANVGVGLRGVFMLSVIPTLKDVQRSRMPAATNRHSLRIISR